MAAVPGSCLIRLQTSSPLMSGSLMSSTTRSGFCLTFWSASWPVSASQTSKPSSRSTLALA